MNKTVSINLGGQVFQIDENAFEKLRKYLESLRNRFSGTDGSEEIIADIESRIAEMFTEKLSNKKQVVVLDDVEQVINVMGRPEDFETGEDEEEPPIRHSRKKSRRLYRNPDDKVIGGVCSGLSAYLGIDDPIWLRLVFLLAFFFGVGGSFIVYIILWLIMPEANTASEKLEMKGEHINISNIEKTLKKDLGDLSEKIHSFSNKEHSQKARNGFERLLELLINLVTFLFKFVFKLVALALIIAGIVAVLCFLLAIILPISITGIALTALYPLLFASKLLLFLGCLALLLVVGIPAFALVFLGFRILLNRRLRFRGIGLSFIGLWIVGLIIASVVAANTALDFRVDESLKEDIRIDQPAGDILILDVSRQQNFADEDVYEFFGFGEIIMLEDQIVLKERINLDVKKSLTNKYELIKTNEARGKTQVKAYHRASSIGHQVQQIDSVLYFEDYITIDKEDQIRGQQIYFTLKVPEGKSIFLAEETKYIIYDIKNVTRTDDRHMVGHTWTMLDEGLTCVDCHWQEKNEDSFMNKGRTSRSFDYEDFDEIDIEGSFELEIKEDDNYSIRISGDQKFVDNVDVDVYGDKLSIETTNRFSDLFKFQKYKGYVEVSLPSLKSLEISGANNSYISGFDEEKIEIEINGASKSNINLDAGTLDFQINGASNTTLTGSGDKLIVRVNGASKLNAFDYKVKTCTIEVSGASNAHVNVSDRLEAEASGASNIKYKGLPKISSEVTGFSSMKPEK